MDTREKMYGVQPIGRRYWAFRIVCNTSVHAFRTPIPMTYVAACEAVTRRAEALGAVDDN